MLIAALLDQDVEDVRITVISYGWNSRTLSPVLHSAAQGRVGAGVTSPRPGRRWA
jgi:hypothetical protein